MVVEELRKRDLWCWNKKHIFGEEEQNLFYVTVYTVRNRAGVKTLHKTIRAENTNTLPPSSIHEMFPAESQTLNQTIKGIL